MRRKCVKGVKRITAKVEAAQSRAAKNKGSDVWPFTATIGDVLRASVTAPDSAGIRQAWECICEKMAVFKLKNKFRVAASRLAKDESTGAFTATLQADKKNMFPNLHINMLFQAEGCAPIVAEVQVHHERVLEMLKQDHKLYEVTRAKSMAAVAAGKGAGVETVTVIDKLVEKNTQLEAEIAALRAATSAKELGGGEVRPVAGTAVSPGGAGINAVRSLQRRHTDVPRVHGGVLLSTT